VVDIDVTDSLDRARRLADATHLAVLSTTRPDGSVHSSLVSAGICDDPISGTPSVGAVVIGNAHKLAYIRQGGRACATFQQGFQWTAIEGPVRIIGPDDPAPGIDVPTLLRDVFIAAGGTHDNWAEYDRVMAEERRAAVFIEPARVTGIG
jgi:hypothetical protein